MEKLINLSKKVKSLKTAQMWFATWESSGDLRKFLIDLIQKNQLQKGENMFGDNIGFYSRMTEIISQGRKKEGDPFTLEDTGDFYESFFVKPFLDFVEISAEGRKKDEDILEKYGETVIGVSEESISLLILEIKPYLIDYVRSKIL
jgi:hypothetical protein